MDNKLIEAYRKFQEADRQYGVQFPIRDLADKELIEFILVQMQGREISEVEALADSLKKVAKKISQQTIVDFYPLSDDEYNKICNELFEAIAREAERELAKQGYYSARSTPDCGDSACDRTFYGKLRTFFKKLFV